MTESLNVSNIKKVITEFNNKHTQKLEILEVQPTIIYVRYMGSITIGIKPCDMLKYGIIISFMDNCGVARTIGTYCNKLKEIIQLVDLVLVTYINNGCNTLNVTAKIRANHWGVKLLTVENDAGYRANLYNGNFLIALVNEGIINIKGVKYHSNQFANRISARYDKSVLNYNEIEKNDTWNEHTDGFQPIKRGIGGDYIHPSSCWQKGMLF